MEKILQNIRSFFGKVRLCYYILIENKLLASCIIVSTIEFYFSFSKEESPPTQSALSAGTFATLLGDYLALILPISLFVFKKLYDLFNKKEYIDTEIRPNVVYFISAMFNCSHKIIEELKLGYHNEDEKYNKDIRYISGYFRQTRSFLRTFLLDVVLFIGVVLISAKDLKITTMLLLALIVVNFIRKYYHGFRSIMEIDNINKNFKYKLENLMDFLKKEDDAEDFFSLLRQWNIKAWSFIENELYSINSIEDFKLVIETYMSEKSIIIREMHENYRGTQYIESMLEALFLKEDALYYYSNFQVELDSFTSKISIKPNDYLEKIFESNSKEDFINSTLNLMTSALSSEKIKTNLFFKKLIELEMAVHLKILEKEEVLVLVTSCLDKKSEFNKDYLLLLDNYTNALRF